MKKISSILATGALALVVLPGAASAHGSDKAKEHSDNNRGVKAMVHAWLDADGNKLKTEKPWKLETEWKKFEHQRAYMGTVTSINGSVLSVTLNGKAYTVNTAGAELKNAYNKVVTVADIKVNDKIMVRGTVDGTTITAKSLVVIPANTHPAKTTGTVTAVNGNTITVKDEHNGIVSNVTVNTSADTQITKDGQAATAADVQVGSQVKVKGLWDETLNVLNAIRINIMTMFSK